MRGFDAVLVLEDIESGRCGEGDVGNAIPGEITNEEASLARVCGRWGQEGGDASALVVLDRTAGSIEYLIEAVTGPISRW